MHDPKTDVPYGTLDLLILKTLETLGPLHGFGLARRIEQVSENLVKLNQGSVYPALLRLQQRGWITAKWGVSETNRRAKFYALTRAGPDVERRAECYLFLRPAGKNSRAYESLGVH